MSHFFVSVQIRNALFNDKFIDSQIYTLKDFEGNIETIGDYKLLKKEIRSYWEDFYINCKPNSIIEKMLENDHTDKDIINNLFIDILSWKELRDE